MFRRLWRQLNGASCTSRRSSSGGGVQEANRRPATRPTAAALVPAHTDEGVCTTSTEPSHDAQATATLPSQPERPATSCGPASSTDAPPPTEQPRDADGEAHAAASQPSSVAGLLDDAADDDGVGNFLDNVIAGNTDQLRKAFAEQKLLSMAQSLPAAAAATAMTVVHVDADPAAQPTVTAEFKKPTSRPSAGRPREGYLGSAARSLQDYELVAYLGSGTFSEVTLARQRSTNELFAIKKTSKQRVWEEGCVQRTLTERQLLTSMQHPFLVRLYQAFQSATHLYYVLEFAQGGDLYYFNESKPWVRETKRSLHKLGYPYYVSSALPVATRTRSLGGTTEEIGNGEPWWRSGLTASARNRSFGACSMLTAEESETGRSAHAERRRARRRGRRAVCMHPCDAVLSAREAEAEAPVASGNASPVQRGVTDVGESAAPVVAESTVGQSTPTREAERVARRARMTAARRVRRVDVFAADFVQRALEDTAVTLPSPYAEDGSRLPMRIIAFFAIEIALVLRYMHGKGFVYRDLKPENVLLKGNGHVTLTDFGVAKYRKAAPVRDTPSEPARTTSFTGTTQYMSPEMLQGLPHDARTDWWSYGCLLFEWTNGRKAFENASQFALFRSIVEDDVQVEPTRDFRLTALELHRRVAQLYRRYVQLTHVHTAPTTSRTPRGANASFARDQDDRVGPRSDSDGDAAARPTVTFTLAEDTEVGPDCNGVHHHVSGAPILPQQPSRAPSQPQPKSPGHTQPPSLTATPTNLSFPAALQSLLTPMEAPLGRRWGQPYGTGTGHSAWARLSRDERDLLLRHATAQMTEAMTLLRELVLALLERRVERRLCGDAVLDHPFFSCPYVVSQLYYNHAFLAELLSRYVGAGEEHATTMTSSTTSPRGGLSGLFPSTSDPAPAAPLSLEVYLRHTVHMQRPATWEKLFLELQVRPPYVPRLRAQDDLRYFPLAVTAMGLSAMAEQRATLREAHERQRQAQQWRQLSFRDPHDRTRSDGAEWDSAAQDNARRCVLGNHSFPSAPAVAVLRARRSHSARVPSRTTTTDVTDPTRRTRPAPDNSTAIAAVNTTTTPPSGSGRLPPSPESIYTPTRTRSRRRPARLPSQPTPTRSDVAGMEASVLTATNTTLNSSGSEEERTTTDVLTRAAKLPQDFVAAALAASDATGTERGVTCGAVDADPMMTRVATTTTGYYEADALELATPVVRTDAVVSASVSSAVTPPAQPVTTRPDMEPLQEVCPQDIPEKTPSGLLTTVEAVVPPLSAHATGKPALHDATERVTACLDAVATTPSHSPSESDTSRSSTGTDDESSGADARADSNEASPSTTSITSSGSDLAEMVRYTTPYPYLPAPPLDTVATNSTSGTAPVIVPPRRPTTAVDSAVGLDEMTRTGEGRWFATSGVVRGRRTQNYGPYVTTLRGVAYSVEDGPHPRLGHGPRATHADPVRDVDWGAVTPDTTHDSAKTAMCNPHGAGSPLELSCTQRGGGVTQTAAQPTSECGTDAANVPVRHYRVRRNVVDGAVPWQVSASSGDVFGGPRDSPVQLWSTANERGRESGAAHSTPWLESRTSTMHATAPLCTPPLPVPERTVRGNTSYDSPPSDAMPGTGSVGFDHFLNFSFAVPLTMGPTVRASLGGGASGVGSPVCVSATPNVSNTTVTETHDM